MVNVLVNLKPRRIRYGIDTYSKCTEWIDNVYYNSFWIFVNQFHRIVIFVVKVEGNRVMGSMILFLVLVALEEIVNESYSYSYSYFAKSDIFLSNSFSRFKISISPIT